MRGRTARSATKVEVLVGVALVATIAFPTAVSAQPDFFALPFAEEYVVLGNESLATQELYFPSLGEGSFGSSSVVPGVGIVDGLDVGDMDGDGDDDFLLCNGDTGQVFLYENQGGGHFVPSLVAAAITATMFCTDVRIFDFDGDGSLDFVVGDNQNVLGTTVYVQSSPGFFDPHFTLDTSWTDTGNNLFGVSVGDVDCDDDGDIVLLGYFGAGAGEVRLYLNDGTGSFSPPVLLFNVNSDFGTVGTTGTALFDLEGDGDLDLVVGGGFSGGTNAGGSGTHYLYLNDGHGSFSQPTGFSFDVNAQTGIDATDLDHDGDHDLVVGVASFGRRFAFIENLGQTLAPPVYIANQPGVGFHGIGAAALSTDQDQDGLKNCRDLCPRSDARATVIFGECDSAVPNTLFADGCSIRDLLTPCEIEARNHGQFVSCVAHVLNGLKRAGIISGAQKGAIQSCAAQAPIPM